MNATPRDEHALTIVHDIARQRARVAEAARRLGEDLVAYSQLANDPDLAEGARSRAAVRLQRFEALINEDVHGFIYRGMLTSPLDPRDLIATLVTSTRRGPSGESLDAPVFPPTAGVDPSAEDRPPASALTGGVSYL